MNSFTPSPLASLSIFLGSFRLFPTFLIVLLGKSQTSVSLENLNYKFVFSFSDSDQLYHLSTALNKKDDLQFSLRHEVCARDKKSSDAFIYFILYSFVFYSILGFWTTHGNSGLMGQRRRLRPQHPRSTSLLGSWFSN